MRSAWLAIAACAASGCSDQTRLRADPPWRDDQWAVVLELDVSGAPRVSSVELLPPGEPAVLELAESDVRRLYALAWDEPMDGCTFAVDAGELPRPPAGRWETDAIDDDLPVVWRDTSRPIALRGTCPDTPRACAGVDLLPLDIGPTYGDLTAVHAFRLEAYVGGEPRSGVDETPELRLINQDGSSRALEVPGARGTLVDMADAGDDIVAGTEHGDLIRLRPTLEHLGRLPGGIRRLSAIEAPSTLLVQRSSTTSPRFAELNLPALGVTPRNDLPDTVRIGIIAGPALEYLATDDGVILRSDRRGRVQVELSIGAAAEAVDLIATTSIAVVLGRYSGVFVRDRDGAWVDVGRPPGQGAPRAAGLLSRDRVIISTTGGGVGLWERGEWCVVPLDARQTVLAIDVATDGRTVWLVGQNNGPGTPPRVLRLIAPP